MKSLAGYGQVRTIAEFRTLDEGEVLEGYFDGFQGKRAPDCTCSRSYWHDWRNGMVDSGRCLPDQAYLMLARAFADTVILG